MNNHRIAPSVHEGIEHRHAQALTEIKQMHTDYQAMQAELIESRRRLDQQENMISMLKEERDRLHQEARVFQRKLIRLAAAMSGMTRLAQDADEIMRSVKEFEETNGEKSVEELLAQLPPRARETNNG